jgi:hypothetical protein
MSDRPQQNIPPEILENIKKYKKHVTITCLECGYTGLMGVKSDKTKWLNCFLLGAIVTTLAAGVVSLNMLPIIFGATVGISSEIVKKFILQCPSCGKDLLRP